MSKTPFNIKSYIRVRPLEASEKRSAHFTFSEKEIIIKGAANNPRSLTFDRVFDEDVKQDVVYSNVVKPMVKEVLDGYNCTVFAYGQTGTGKTHTMTGEFDGTSPRNCPQSGIIPRALEEIFNELALLNQEHVVTITFIELYNEKLISLINDDSDIGLAEGADGNVVFKNLNPIPVNTIGEAMKLLQIGNEKRSTASTNINATTSRSHSIFTITVKIKEPKIDSEELRTAKLHMVDLAGSENVTKSGVNNMPKTQDKSWSVSPTNNNPRFNETIKINVSLLVLRRVILSLTENAYHVPYRESKLTRLLMDSLGGKTKTCIIGTISPSTNHQVESESTLKYAAKARSIKNKPVKNTTESKKEFLQEFTYDEISRPEGDLEANRQGDSFSRSQESYNEMTERLKQLSDQIERLNDELNKSNKQQNEEISRLRRDLEANRQGERYQQNEETMTLGVPSGAMPKGPITAYLFFVQFCHKEAKKKEKEGGEKVVFSSISTQCSQKWKTLNKDERSLYDKMAVEDKKRHDSEMLLYMLSQGEKVGSCKGKQTKDNATPKRAQPVLKRREERRGRGEDMDESYLAEMDLDESSFAKPHVKLEDDDGDVLINAVNKKKVCLDRVLAENGASSKLNVPPARKTVCYESDDDSPPPMESRKRSKTEMCNDKQADKDLP